MKRVFAVILAAGTSSRLGFNKLTVTIDGEPVIRRSVKPFFVDGIDRVIVVTGHNRQNIEKALEGLAVELVHNPRYTEGMSTSVRVAIPFFKDAGALIFHLGDKPLITTHDVKSVLNAYMADKARIVAPLYKGRMGHPVMIDADLLRAELGMLHGDSGLRDVIEKYRKDVVFIEGNDGSQFDIDTIQAVEQLRERGYRVEENKR